MMTIIIIIIIYYHNYEPLAWKSTLAERNSGLLISYSFRVNLLNYLRQT